MNRQPTRIIQIQPQETPAVLDNSGSRFDAHRAREACVALIELCDGLDEAPKHARPLDAKEELKAFGVAVFEVLRTLLPAASVYALSEAAQALMVLYSASRLDLERAPAKVVAFGGPERLANGS